MDSRQQLRKQMRSKRRSLSLAEQEYFANLLAAHFSKKSIFRNAQRIAFYISNDGELDLLPLMIKALAMGKDCYLPVLGLFRPQLTFARYSPEVSMGFNQFGIPEPVCHARQRIKPMALDLVLTPLVAFDRQGNRLGMGGGYYDRSFSFLRYRKNWSKPNLVGVAHAFQQVESISSKSWDVPLSAIVTATDYFSVRLSGKST